MDPKSTESRSLEQRFVEGRLSPEEHEELELRCLTDPELLERLEQAERELAELREQEPELADPDLVDPRLGELLKEGLDHLERTGKLSEHRARSGWSAKFSSPQFAAAASVLLAVSLVFSGALYRQNQRLEEFWTEGGATTRLIPLISVRGATANKTLAGGAQEWVVLLVDPGAFGYSSYKVDISRQIDGKTQNIWQAKGLEPGYADFLSVGLPGALLEPGKYEIRVTGRMADWPADRASDELSRLPLEVTAESS
jgi:hypothetical protein